MPFRGAGGGSLHAGPKPGQDRNSEFWVRSRRSGRGGDKSSGGNLHDSEAERTVSRTGGAGDAAAGGERRRARGVHSPHQSLGRDDLRGGPRGAEDGRQWWSIVGPCERSLFAELRDTALPRT